VRITLRSLTVKIALVVLAVSLISVGLVAFFSGWVTVREYDNLLSEQIETAFAAGAATYYETRGSWVGFNGALIEALQPGMEPRRFGGRRGMMGGGEGAALFPFVLIDADGCVVGPPGPGFRQGDCLETPELAAGKPVEVAGKRVGTVLATGAVVVRDTREELFLERINRGLLWGAIGASIVALLLGVGLATTLTRPLRRLTDAIHAMAAGNLEQRVDVRAQDEIGELAGAFNRMSTELSQSNQLRKQMTADIAHELRNPLMVMTGYIEALREGVLRPTPERFDVMYEEAQRLQRLVADLRTLSLADAGELPLNRQPTAPAALLTRVAEAYEPAATQKGVRLVQEADRALPVVDVDAERIGQVLANLVANALRHTPADGEIRLGARAEAGGVALVVADNGEGIPPDVLPRIFERLYRGDHARSQDGDESGLGLAIAKSLVTAHGGMITVASTVGRGSTFTVHLPAAPASTATR
jgi:signal transduction histidine kinase